MTALHPLKKSGQAISLEKESPVVDADLSDDDVKYDAIAYTVARFVVHIGPANQAKPSHLEFDGNCSPVPSCKIEAAVSNPYRSPAKICRCLTQVRLKLGNLGTRLLLSANTVSADGQPRRYPAAQRNEATAATPP